MSEDRPPKVLCHPDGKKSCGACCGMYNHVEHGQSQTMQRLRRRTRAFHRNTSIDDEASLKAFRQRWEDDEKVKLMTGLPSCPFLGFVDGVEPSKTEQQGRARIVGCLVHPLQNDGVDGRDCGVYDRFICEDYLCAAHNILRTDEIRLVLDSIDDSYLYGLVITNPKFVRQLLELVARRTGAWPSKKVLSRPAVLEAAGRCFEQMREWPYRDNDGIFGPVGVTGAVETRRRDMPADVFDVDPDPVDMLLVCMGTACKSTEELYSARRRIDAEVDALAAAVKRAQP